MTATSTGIDGYRALRRELEAAVLPLATSIDGRSFTFQASLDSLALRVGGYVVLETADGPAMGQILELGIVREEAADLEVAADGPAPGVRARLVLSRAGGHGAIVDRDVGPFHDAAIRGATPAEVGEWAERGGKAPIEIGELALAQSVPCRIDAGGFNRHTFLCGQSGSGKTYALGVLLERLLQDTTLRIVVLDPNSDFTRLGAIRQGTDLEVAECYRRAAAEVTVHSAHQSGAQRLRLRIAELEPAAQAALLRIDPIADREEYSAFADLLASGTPPTAAALEATGRPEAHRLAARARNLGLERYSLWARADAGSVLDAVSDPAQRCVVVDLGSLGTHEEQALAAAAVLGTLWQHREERNPVLIVIDEAHNVCPDEPPDGLTALATEHCIRIAAEGRKFGLYLLLSTQRPQKVPENVTSQCDNLVLMRLNSRADVALASERFSFVPAGLIAQAATFRLGEALVGGKIAPYPALLRFGRRVSEEGGSDVPTAWAAAAG